MALITATSIASTQTLITFQGGSNFRQDKRVNVDSWNPAISGSVGIEHFLTGSFAIVTDLQYNSYSFDTYRGFVTIHDSSPTTSLGDATQSYGVSLEGKFIVPSRGRLSPFFITGASYMIERVGQIKLSSIYPGGPNMYMTIPSRTDYYWMHTFGLGLRYLISDSLGFDLTGKLNSNYKNRDQASLKFGLFYIL